MLCQPLIKKQIKIKHNILNHLIKINKHEDSSVMFGYKTRIGSFKQKTDHTEWSYF